MTPQARDSARRVAGNPVVEALARLGHVMVGVIHVLVGWLAVQLAIGGTAGDEEASQTGALAQIAEGPGGQIMLWVGAAVLGVLALWQLLEAMVGPAGSDPDRQVAPRLSAAGKAVVYAALAVIAGRFAAGAGEGSGTASVTASLMQTGWGRVVIVLVAIGILIVAIYYAFKGAARKFEEDLGSTGDRGVNRAVLVIGTVGYIAKGLSLGAIGVMVLWGVFSADPGRASGLDVALRTLAGTGGGAAILVLIAIGLVLYGVYKFLFARYARL